MQLIESASINGNPNGPKLMRDVRGMMYKFDTGHRYVKFVDGFESFESKPGKHGRTRTLNVRTDVHLIAEMRRLAAIGIV